MTIFKKKPWKNLSEYMLSFWWIRPSPFLSKYLAKLGTTQHVPNACLIKNAIDALPVANNFTFFKTFPWNQKCDCERDRHPHRPAKISAFLLIKIFVNVLYLKTTNFSYNRVSENMGKIRPHKQQHFSGISEILWCLQWIGRLLNTHLCFPGAINWW